MPDVIFSIVFEHAFLVFFVLENVMFIQDLVPEDAVSSSRYVFSHLYLLVDTYSEKAMALHSSTLAWKIPWMEKPGGLQSVGSLKVGHN